MTTFRDSIYESAATCNVFQRFAKLNTPLGTIGDARSHGNVYTIRWTMVEPQDIAKLKSVEKWVASNVSVEDIELEIDRVKGTAMLMFVADDLPASMNSTMAF